MASALLKTKLFIPPARPELVQRGRLIERLDGGLGRKLILVCAPAGFGKTTLLSTWAARCGRPIAWLTLDEGDNDPARFLAYLVASLQTVEAELGKGIMSGLPSLAASKAEEKLIELLNQITTHAEHFVLVLDDYHTIQAQAIHDAITFLLDHLPTQMHLVIATRSDPPLPIARLRGRGELVELRQSDLRFTPAEAAEFLKQVMGLSLSSQYVETLAMRTEGWVAGLQMAALALQSIVPAQGDMKDDEVSAFVQAFSGSHHYVLDFLMEEVFRRQTEAVKSFLLRTSILDQMCGTLCDAVLGLGGGEESSCTVLDYLEHANLFLVALDDRREWYRYHQLFAEFLKRGLEESLPEAIPVLHRRAAEWYEKHEFVVEAIDHTLNAKDYQSAANLIQQIAEATLQRSEVVTLLRWIEALPDQMVLAKPSLCVYHAWALLLAGQPLQMIERRLQEASKEAGMTSGAAAALRAFIATFQGKIPEASAFSQQALEELSEGDQFLHSVMTWIMGIASMWWSKNLVEGMSALDNATEVSLAAGNLMVAVVALSSLGEMYMMMGKLRKAQEIYDRALQLAVDETGGRLPIAGMALIGLGELLRRWNDLDTARDYLEEGLRLNRSWGEIGMLDGYASLALVEHAQGDIDGAHQEIQKARKVARSFDVTELDDAMIDAQEAQLWVAHGDLEATRQWAERRGLSVETAQEVLEVGDDRDFLGSSYLGAMEYLTLARLLLAEGRWEESLSVLEKLVVAAEERGFYGYVIEIQMLMAVGLQVAGETSEALEVLERALSLAEPDGHVRVFLEAGDPLKELLEAFTRQHQSSDRLRDYTVKLLTAFGLEIGDQREGTERGISFLAEPLSQREVEVLRLVSAGFTNREIAEKLVVAISTVKTHVHHVYNKLGVSKRTQAVARARELGLL